MGLLQATDLDTSLGSNALCRASVNESFDIIDSFPSWEFFDAPWPPSISDSPRVSTSTITFPSISGSIFPENEASSMSEVELWKPLGIWSGPHSRQGSGDCHIQSPSSFADFLSLEDGFVRPDPDAPVAFLPTFVESSASRNFQCDWPQCPQKGPFTGVEGWKSHKKDHARAIHKSWKPFQQCSWHGCPSKARYKTTKLFEDHLNNIHINPLICTIEGCRHKKPFRGKADLQRHINSVHMDGSKLRCPFSKCTTEGRDFSRKDKLISHLREIHDTDHCPYSHCVEELNPMTDSTAKHIGKLHGEFECALRSCKKSTSQFCERGFLDHLQLDHNMNWETVLRTRDIAKIFGDKTLRDEHIIDVRDCNICCSFSN
ncbi:hypothetical protein EG329_013124 [Mollisiaceae sp. DMI_Dod_QoI]|nr:hypothetical protein EG329_013124 [Helotiales sp. DMI_Dod_QoI]